MKILQFALHAEKVDCLMNISAILIAFWEGVLSSHNVLLKGNLIARVNYQVTNPHYRAMPENTA